MAFIISAARRDYFLPSRPNFRARSEQADYEQAEASPDMTLYGTMENMEVDEIHVFVRRHFVRL